MSLSKKSVSSSILLIIDALSQKLIGLASTLILARVLTPQDFGLVAMAAIIGMFLDTFANLGTQEYIIKSRRPTRQLLYSAFTLSLIIRGATCLLLFISAYQISIYFNEPALFHVLIVYSIMMLLHGLENPAVHLLRRRQEYKPIVFVTINSKFIAVIVSIYLALNYQTYWALIVGTFIFTLMNLIGGYLIYPFMPTLSFSNIAKQWLFSKWLIIQGFIGFGRVHLDTFIASTIFGKTYLGYYNTMKYIAFIPLQTIVTPFIEPLLADFAPLVNEKEKLKQKLNVTLMCISLLTVPMAAFAFIFHFEIVSVLLGDQWTEFSLIFAWFMILIVSATYAGFIHKLLIVRGKTKYLVYYELLITAFVLVCILMMSFDDIKTFAMVKTLSEFSIVVLLFFVMLLAYFGFAFSLSTLFFQSVIVMSSIIVALISRNLLVGVTDSAILVLVLGGICFTLLMTTFFGLTIKLLSKRSESFSMLESLLISTIQTIGERLINRD